MTKVLLVDDDPALLRVLGVGLRTKGYYTLLAHRGRDAVALAAHERPDVLVVDLGLPDLDGLEVLQQVRRAQPVKVLVLSTFGDERTKVRVLDGGADDYMTKPFGMAELEARIRALLRRADGTLGPLPTAVRSAGLSLDESRQQAVAEDGSELRLTRREFALLHLLVANAGRLCTHRMILDALWGPGYEDPHYVRVYVNRLRTKLGPRGTYLETRAGIGYCWTAPLDPGTGERKP
jgi:two-component system KDP operon response regulator KdpE